MVTGTKALYAVEKILTNKRMIKDIEKLSPHFQTSSWESFHSVILRFAPKNVVYPYLGLLCRCVWNWYNDNNLYEVVLIPFVDAFCCFYFRLYLAGMHFNENSNCPQAKTSTGKPMNRPLFLKAKKGIYSMRSLNSQATYCELTKFIDVHNKVTKN